MKKKITVLCILLSALVLEILPCGAVCNFGNPEGEPWRVTYSYFSLIPYGYANFGPLITAILTCAMLVIIILSIILKKGLEQDDLGHLGNRVSHLAHSSAFRYRELLGCRSVDFGLPRRDFCTFSDKNLKFCAKSGTSCLFRRLYK